MNAPGVTLRTQIDLAISVNADRRQSEKQEFVVNIARLTSMVACATCLLGTTVAHADPTNLLLNPGFEAPEIMDGDGGQLPGADDWNTGTVAGVRSMFQNSGAQSLRLAPNGMASTDLGFARQSFPTSPGEVYSLGAWVFHSSAEPLTGDRTAQLRIQWFNAANNLLSQATLDVLDASSPTDAWTFVALDSIIIPSNAAIVQVRAGLFVTNDGGSGTGAAFFDDASFVEGSLIGNLIENAGFEAPQIMPGDNGQLPGADDWNVANTVGVRTMFRHSGAQSLRVAPNGPTGTLSGIARQSFPASANDVFSLSAWVFHPGSDPVTGTRKAQLRIQWFNDSDTLINQQILDVLDSSSPTGEWMFNQLQDVVLPDNENIVQVRAGVFVVNDGGTGGGAAFFDDVVFAPGDAPECLVCEIDGQEGTDVSDLLFFLSLWFVGDPGADIDGSPGVDVSDLLNFLSCWFVAAN